MCIHNLFELTSYIYGINTQKYLSFPFPAGFPTSSSTFPASRAGCRTTSDTTIASRSLVPRLSSAVMRSCPVLLPVFMRCEGAAVLAGGRNWWWLGLFLGMPSDSASLVCLLESVFLQEVKHGCLWEIVNNQVSKQEKYDLGLRSSSIWSSSIVKRSCSVLLTRLMRYEGAAVGGGWNWWFGLFLGAFWNLCFHKGKDIYDKLNRWWFGLFLGSPFDSASLVCLLEYVRVQGIKTRLVLNKSQKYNKHLNVSVQCKFRKVKHTHNDNANSNDENMRLNSNWGITRQA